MTVTTLDPVTALVVVDLQRGVVALPLAHPINEVVGNTVRLLEAWREAGLPVVLVNVNGRAPGRTAAGAAAAAAPASSAAPTATVRATGGDELVPELDRQPSDKLVTKRTWGAFTGTDLEEWLKGEGATQVVVAGVATGSGVESTARQAHELGFNVTLASDAMTDMHADTHAFVVASVFPRLGEVGTTDELLGLLAAQARR